jgi:ABC-type glycerol-3-phosphate transport system substrate-binding protein
LTRRVWRIRTRRWTVDDFANAARLLTQYNADGTVATAGFSVSSGGNNLNVFWRALAGAALYDAATMPNAPDFSNPALEHILQVAYEMIQDGVVVADGGGRFDEIPLRVEGVNGYTSRGFGPDQENEQTVRYATLLPGGVAGLNVQGFAVSVGTQQPELAYELAKFLTNRPELASNFFSVSPARYSLVGQGNPAGLAASPSAWAGQGEAPFRHHDPAEIQPSWIRAVGGSPMSTAL